jgi:hypothetical protein
MNKKYLHFLPFSQSQYPQLVAQWFERVAPDAHLFVEFGKNETQKNENWHIKRPNSSSFKQLFKENEFEKIFIHSFNPTVAKVLLSHFSTADTGGGRTRPQIVWLVWGGDFYYLPRIIESIFEPFAHRFFRRDWWWQLRTHAGKIAFYFGKSTAETMMRALPLVDALGCTPTEFGLICEKLPELRSPKFMPYWSLLSLPQLSEKVKKINQKVVEKNNYDILLGSSAGIGNNHFEAMEWLAAQSNLPNGKVICPLPRGRGKYIQKIIEKGEILFGDRFVPVRSFLPFSEFQSLIASVGLVLYRHGRQEGFGALLPFFNNGTLVFLSEKNALFHDFKNELGLHGIYSFRQSFSETTPLSATEIAENQATLATHFSDIAIFEQYKNLIL